MRTGGKSALTVREACLAAGLTFLLGIAQAEEAVRIVISDETVSIRADNKSLRCVLEELTRQTNLIVVSQEALDEMVTVDIDEPTLPLAIRRLLRQKSFMLHQLKHVAVAEYPYSRLWIFSADANDGEHAWAMQADSWPPADGDSELIDYQILALSDNSRDREEAMYGFAEIGSSRVVEYLQQGLDDPDGRVREAAIESLSDVGGTASVHALSNMLDDPDAGIRIDAVDALGDIGGQEAIKLLREAMADDNHTVREAAAEWLTELAWQND